jgi:hypothetical protein
MVRATAWLGDGDARGDPNANPNPDPDPDPDPNADVNPNPSPSPNLTEATNSIVGFGLCSLLLHALVEAYGWRGALPAL